MVKNWLIFAKKISKIKYGKALKKEDLKFAKTAGKQLLKKTAESTVDLIGSKIADEITSLSSKPEEPQEEQQEQEEIIEMRKDYRLTG